VDRTSAWLGRHAVVCRWMVATVVVAVMGLVLGTGRPVAAQSAPAPDPPARPPAVSAGAIATVVSAFVWRGWVVADEVCVQPSAWITAGGLTLTSWVNVLPLSEGDSFTEHDLTLDYTWSVGRWALSAGYINYYYPTADVDRWTNELYLGADISVPLNPSVRVYQDVHRGSGTYVSVGVSHEVTIGATGLSVTPSAVLGYNNGQWVEGSGWSDLSVGVLVAVPLGRHADASASVSYSRSLNQDWFPSKAWGGLTVTVY
jgi:hypothetical protein